MITNVPEIADATEKKCSRQHKHFVLEGSHSTQAAAEYCEGFIDAILGGLKQALRRRGLIGGDPADNHSYLVEVSSPVYSQGVNLREALGASAEHYVMESIKAEVFLQVGGRP